MKHSVASAAISANGSRSTSSGRELAGDRDRKLDRFGFEPLLDRGKPARQPVERVADLLERDRGAARGDRGAFLLGGGKAVAEALALGLGELDACSAGAIGLLGRGGARREVLVEQIFGLRAAI